MESLGHGWLLQSRLQSKSVSGQYIYIAQPVFSIKNQESHTDPSKPLQLVQASSCEAWGKQTR